MMRLHLVFVGRTAFRDVDSAVERYIERLRHYVSISVHIVKGEKATSKNMEETAREREGERILKLLSRRDYLVVWDRGGKQPDSEGLAGFLERLGRDGVSDLWTAIGGPFGISAKVVERADCLLSLSKMTFPHDLARLVIAEQLYRAFTILKGEPYHR